MKVRAAATPFHARLIRQGEEAAQLSRGMLDTLRRGGRDSSNAIRRSRAAIESSIALLRRLENRRRGDTLPGG